jgi:inward rectifier potassium channel
VLAIDLVINLVFALLYLVQPGAISNAPSGSFPAAFFFSMETLATVGYGVMAPATLYGHIIASVEILCGMAFTAVMTGLIFVRFAKPKSKILFAEKAVVARHNGDMTLMIRIGSGRVTPLASASVNLSAVQTHRTTEGHVYRGGTPLTLERSHQPFFALTWTLLHRIVPGSPLWGMSIEDLEARHTNFLLMAEARDQALGAQVYDSHYYGANDILFGMRYQDAVTTDADGHVLADMTRLSLVEPDPFSAPTQSEAEAEAEADAPAPIPPAMVS